MWVGQKLGVSQSSVSGHSELVRSLMVAKFLSCRTYLELFLAPWTSLKHFKNFLKKWGCSSKTYFAPLWIWHLFPSFASCNLDVRACFHNKISQYVSRIIKQSITCYAAIAGRASRAGGAECTFHVQKETCFLKRQGLNSLFIRGRHWLNFIIQCSSQRTKLL